MSKVEKREGKGGEILLMHQTGSVLGCISEKKSEITFWESKHHYGRHVVPLDKQARSDFSPRSTTEVWFYIWWLKSEHQMLDFCCGFVDSAPLFFSLPGDPWSWKWSKDDENCNHRLRKYTGRFSFLFSLKKMALYTCQVIFFFLRQWKQNYLLRNVWSCQNPAEWPLTSGTDSGKCGE